MHRRDWGLAEQALRLDLRAGDESPATWVNLGRCLWELGRGREAEAAFARAAELDPTMTEASRARRVARAWSERCEALPWWSPQAASDGPITLEPLGARHVADFWRHGQGASVVAQTPLPRFESAHEVALHIDALTEREGVSAFAVLEHRHGFIGEATLERTGPGQAELSFWIGEDFQGRGHGTRAARLCLAQARRMGLEQVIAEVARDNHRSRAALLAAGGVDTREAGAERWRLSFRLDARVEGQAP